MRRIDVQHYRYKKAEKTVLEAIESRNRGIKADETIDDYLNRIQGKTERVNKAIRAVKESINPNITKEVLVESSNVLSKNGLSGFDFDVAVNIDDGKVVDLDSGKLNESIINEAKVEVDGVDELIEQLNVCKLSAERGKGVNLLIDGLHGIAKSATVEAWAEANNIRVLSLSLSAFDPSDISGIIDVDKSAVPLGGEPRATRYTLDSFDELFDKSSPIILFLDELNRARGTVRGQFLKLINEHKLAGRAGDISIDNPNFLFTVAAINNPLKGYIKADEMDPAETGRFRYVDYFIGPEGKKSFRDYLLNKPWVKESTWMPEFIKKLLNSSKFNFDRVIPKSSDPGMSKDSGGVYLTNNPRGFEDLLRASQTPKDVIKGWSGHMKSDSETVNLVSSIIGAMADKKDKATELFGSEESKKKAAEDTKKDKSKDDSKVKEVDIKDLEAELSDFFKKTK